MGASSAEPRRRWNTNEYPTHTKAVKIWSGGAQAAGVALVAIEGSGNYGRRRLFGIGYRRELLDERAMALNRLHGGMEELRSGYHTEITSLGSVKGLNQAAGMLRDDESARVRVVRSRITRIRALNRQVKDLTAKKSHER